MNILSADLSTSHGAILVTQWKSVVAHSRLKSICWPRPNGDYPDLGYKSTGDTAQIETALNRIWYKIMYNATIFGVDRIVLDWDPNSIYWGGRKIAVLYQAQLIGMIRGWLLEKGASFKLQLVRPSDLRRGLGYKGNVSKGSLHQAVANISESLIIPEDQDNKARDLQDALILAYYSYLSKRGLLYE